MRCSYVSRIGRFCELLQILTEGQIELQYGQVHEQQYHR